MWDISRRLSKQNIVPRSILVNKNDLHQRNEETGFSQEATTWKTNVFPVVPRYSFILSHETDLKELPCKETNIPSTNSGKKSFLTFLLRNLIKITKLETK